MCWRLACFPRLSLYLPQQSSVRLYQEDPCTCWILLSWSPVLEPYDLTFSLLSGFWTPQSDGCCKIKRLPLIFISLPLSSLSKNNRSGRVPFSSIKKLSSADCRNLLIAALSRITPSADIRVVNRPQGFQNIWKHETSSICATDFFIDFLSGFVWFIAGIHHNVTHAGLLLWSSLINFWLHVVRCWTATWLKPFVLSDRIQSTTSLSPALHTYSQCTVVTFSVFRAGPNNVICAHVNEQQEVRAQGSGWVLVVSPQCPGSRQQISHSSNWSSRRMSLFPQPQMTVSYCILFVM